ncbi:hypothetical protein BDN72DRAFT_848019 [Pluteus cervinus]|uniref:Uncharacterized protein n=1 Tax=Pluteus cervinus TaxID=181527 RepID=A0ACD3ACF9_9AGAR|nr:hypothetical protein BDN72DRAFT_848019 [Pluteus cervinus]
MGEESPRGSLKRPRELQLEPSIEILEGPSTLSQQTNSTQEEDELMGEDGGAEISAIEKMLDETRQPERKRAKVSPPTAKIERNDTLDYRDIAQVERATSMLALGAEPACQAVDPDADAALPEQEGEQSDIEDNEDGPTAAPNETLTAEQEETKPFMAFQGKAKSKSVTRTPAPAPSPPSSSQRNIPSPARSDASLPPPRFSQPVPLQSQRPRPRPAPRPSQVPKTPIEVIEIMDSPPPSRRQTASLSSFKPSSPSTSQTAISISQGSRSQPGCQGTRPPLKFKRHPVHWQLDGNLLVQLDGVRFKLQRSRLVRASQWFEKACESLNRRDHEEDVIMLDDLGFGVEDFVTLLDTMDNAITYCFKDPPFRTIASVLLTSFVLSFEAYYTWASRHFREMWFAGNELEHVTQNNTDYGPEEAIKSIYLARKCEVKGVLKSAMYYLVRRAGFGQPDDEDEDAEDELNGASVSPKSKRKKSPKIRLSNADVKRLIHARENLTSQWTVALAIPSVDLSRCFAPPVPYQKCTAQEPLRIHEIHQKLIHKSGLFEEYIYDPMGGFEVLRSHLIPPEDGATKGGDVWQNIKQNGKWGNDKIGGYCVECVQKRYDVWGSTRKKVWENLDLWFGLEGEREENAADESGDDDDDDDDGGEGGGGDKAVDDGVASAGVADADQEMADA